MWWLGALKLFSRGTLVMDTYSQGGDGIGCDHILYCTHQFSVLFFLLFSRVVFSSLG